MKLKCICIVFLSVITAAYTQTTDECVTIKGYVADYQNNPLDSICRNKK
jgi:hypothetical protein